MLSILALRNQILRRLELITLLCGLAQEIEQKLPHLQIVTDMFTSSGHSCNTISDS